MVCRTSLLGMFGILTAFPLGGCTPSARARYEVTLHGTTPRTTEPDWAMTVAFGLDSTHIRDGTVIAIAEGR